MGNMFYCVDSLSVHQKHEDLDDIIAKNSGDAEEEVLRRGEAMKTKWLKTWTTERMEDLKLHVTNRTKHKNLFWDAETPLQWAPPEVNAEEEPSFPDPSFPDPSAACNVESWVIWKHSCPAEGPTLLTHEQVKPVLRPEEELQIGSRLQA